MCHRSQTRSRRTSGTESGISASSRPSSFSPPRTQRLRPLDGEEGVRPERQRDVPMPRRPAAHLVVVQAHFTLPTLEALLDRPPGARRPDDALQRRARPGEHGVVGQLRRGLTCFAPFEPRRDGDPEHPADAVTPQVPKTFLAPRRRRPVAVTLHLVNIPPLDHR